MEARRIILARHGQTTWNLAHRFQGKTDTDLTDVGREQASALADRLSSWPAEVIYTSPLRRAVDTAKIIAEKQREALEPVVIDDLCEIDFASWEGQSIPELGEPYLRWRRDPFFNEPDGAESWEELKTRFGRAVKKILSGPEHRIIIVSHGGVVRALYSLIVGIDPHQAWNIECTNCSISGVIMRSSLATSSGEPIHINSANHDHGHEHESVLWLPPDCQPVLSFANDNLHIRGGEAGRHLPVWG